jgi:uncharacterized protein (DUF1015 family)
MKLSFTDVAVAIEAIDLNTNARVWVKINGSPKHGFTLSTEVVEEERTDTAAMATHTAASSNENYVDLTSTHHNGGDPMKSNGLVSFLKTENTLNDESSLESESPKSDDEVEYIGTRNNKKENVSLVNESDSSLEYEMAVGLSQDPFFSFPANNKKSALPRRSNRMNKSTKI